MLTDLILGMMVVAVYDCLAEEREGLSQRVLADAHRFVSHRQHQMAREAYLTVNINAWGPDTVN